MEKRLLQTLLCTFAIAALSNIAFAQDREGVNTITHLEDGTVLLTDFEDYEVNTIPSDWYNQKGEGRPYTFSGTRKEEYKYHIESENGNQFLRYEGSRAKHLNFPLLNKDINLYETPILSWDWRIYDIPFGASEDDKNDVAASIYVVFDMGRVLFKRVPKSIRYTWSSTLEKGKELSKFFGNQKIVVMGTGDNNLGKWQTFERNIVEDYRRLFGDDPPETPIAILVLSDGNDTDSVVKADYDNLMLKPAQ